MKKQEGFSAGFTRHPEGKIGKPGEIYFLIKRTKYMLLFIKFGPFRINKVWYISPISGNEIHMPSALYKYIFVLSHQHFHGDLRKII
jgi:hypothetical protein